METNEQVASLLARVQEIAPILRAHAAQGEVDRQLSKAAVEAMVEARLFRMWTPRLFKGLEADPITAMRVFEEVSRIDSAAGWNLQLSCSIAPAFAWFSDTGTREVFGDNPDVILGGTLFPPGRALPVKGGYRLTGRWPIVSGCHHCAWFIAPALVTTNGSGRDTTEIVVAYRAEDARILDTWHTMGMRGTGSHDVLADDVFIPEHRSTVLKANPKRCKAFQGPLYSLSIWPTTAALAAPAFGIARAAIDAILELCKYKTPAYGRLTLRDRPTVQAQVARAEALLGAARAYVYESLREAWEFSATGQAFDVKQKMKVLIATTYGIQSAAEAVDIVYEVAGTTAIRNESPFQRYFRDVHVITQHAFASTSRYESVGKLLLGLETDWTFISL